MTPHVFQNHWQSHWQNHWAQALLDPAGAPPPGVARQAGTAPDRRFAVYRNNVMVSLTGALAARFPAVKRIVGDEFFDSAARAFASKNPPRSPLMMTYGEEFPDFIARLDAASAVPYLADVARLEAARTRAYHADDAAPLTAADLAGVSQETLFDLRFVLHPSLELVASRFPVVTIWAMNAGDLELAEITDWSGETALIVRPALDVEVRRPPPGAAAFLASLAAGDRLGDAAAAALAQSADFDLAVNLAALFSGGLAIDAAAAKDDPQ
ncbi:DNA-binding domain-containing protein [Methylocapsa palsarum]|uniref:Putative DNA-binding domain-containing protein n=1 Tax=Methylocapsa palsarum TaxID=1612308 RepID=A0A1I3W397_9HYPH|nr:DNA-binding domain-containing protein [Methylocapsa palsarum]SFK01117.1 Putative DNA-binding domain-containing protein [Methylocapsa palsarum]